jgi:hypothetical protein
MKVKYLSTKTSHDLSIYPSFSATGSIKGMKDKYYGKDALLIKSGNYIYNVSSCPYLYYQVAY